MKKHIMNSLVIFGLACFFSAYAQAAGTTSSSSTANVTAVILCEEDGGISVDHSQVSINTDTCSCTAYDEDNEAVGCGGEEGDICPSCLASLQRGGLSIRTANGYLDTDNSERKMHYLLTGNGGPFVTRFGCFCDE